MKLFYENICKRETISKYEYEETFRNNFNACDILTYISIISIFTSKIPIIKIFPIIRILKYSQQ